MIQTETDLHDEIHQTKDEVEEHPPLYSPKVRWVIPQRLDFMTFVGKYVLAVVHDIYIVCLNIKTKTEHIYVANDRERKGDGVDVICGHRSYLFAFAEKVKNARIFVVKYPSFTVLSEFRDYDVNRYKGLCMMECDLIAGFTGFPNYLCTIWNWRTKQRLVTVETGVIRRRQIYMASRMHMTVCECWGEGLIVWEVGQCFKKCFLLRRAKEEVTGWEISEPPLVDICWTHEGNLYAIDPRGILYSVASDGIAMVTKVEWSPPSDIVNTNKPCICAFGNGMLLYGPDSFIRSLKKNEDSKSWSVVWTYQVEDTVMRLISNTTCNVAAIWTDNGYIYSLKGESEDKIKIELFTYKMRHVQRIQLIAPDYKYLAAMNEVGTLAFYNVATAELVHMQYVNGLDISFQASPVDPLTVVFGEVTGNYGMLMQLFDPKEGLTKVDKMSLTHQIVSRVTFSPTGRELVAGAMSAGHVFIFKLSEDYKLTLVRYTELGRGLADCLLMKVGEHMRCFSLVLFSDKYAIGERVICINAVTGKDNKFAGKMQGPYSKLLPCAAKDTMIGVPHLCRQFHVLKLSGEKGVTVSVKMGPIIDTGHEIKQFDGLLNQHAFMTYSYDGTLILRQPDAPEEYELKLTMTHRYPSGGYAGFKEAVIDADNEIVVHLGGNQTMACVFLQKREEMEIVIHKAPDKAIYDQTIVKKIDILHEDDKNYLDLQEEKRVREEAMDYRGQRDEVCKTYDILQERLFRLLEENIAEVPLHQLPLSEFDLHFDAKKERQKEADNDREMLRLQTEARIRAQDKVTAWIKERCWDSMKTPRIKLFAIFSHYFVENYAMLPSHSDMWKELAQIEALRRMQKEGREVFKPWEELEPVEVGSVDIAVKMSSSQALSSLHSTVQNDDDGVGDNRTMAGTEVVSDTFYSLSGTVTHLFVPVPRYIIPQTLAYSFLHMEWMQHITKLNTQNLRLWFNKQFDEMMSYKTREIGLVKERNARLRFIVQELNKLSDLRGSFHHLIVEIRDPEWRQEEDTQRLVKVDPVECTIEPYISPSQIVIIPPDPGPKDDFRERALIEMMDGVLEKLWHEEIKKPIPMPQCMLDKDPEHFNEEDLRHVFEYEAKVQFRNEERDKYRKMLHAEYAKLSATLNEGILKFNQKMKETWLTKVRIDQVIGQENFNLLRLRRINLDRIEMAELIEKYREEKAELEESLEILNDEMQQIQEQIAECTTTYDVLTVKDKSMDKTFKNHFADLSPIIIEQCYKFFKKRPKWHQRATMIPSVLYELAQGVSTGVKPRHLHIDCVEYFRAVEQLDQISNMPAVMDEHLWTTMCKLRRGKIDNEIRIRALAQDTTYVENAFQVWSRAVQARRVALTVLHAKMTEHRVIVEKTARNKTIQLVLPAGQVEIITTGHLSDFEDATLIPREDIEKINNVILKVGAMKLRMMRKQMDFRKGILSKEWEHAQMKMKLRHMEQELRSYQRLKIPKELQKYLKEKELGYTDEIDYMRLEKEMESSKTAINKALARMIHNVEDLEVKVLEVDAEVAKVDRQIVKLNVKVSQKRIEDDPLQPIRIRRIFKDRMETLVARSRLVREVQQNHSTIVMLQTELELLRLKTYPTLASFRQLK